jgi:hypothetical protein
VFLITLSILTFTLPAEKGRTFGGDVGEFPAPGPEPEPVRLLRPKPPPPPLPLPLKEPSTALALIAPPYPPWTAAALGLTFFRCEDVESIKLGTRPPLLLLPPAEPRPFDAERLLQ